MTERFLELLLEATARVAEPYFLLPVAGMEIPIYRERVYCYELYHQLRMLLDGEPRLAEFSLCGEIDKQGHPTIGRYIPDFVFHTPGKKQNLVVVEVKPVNAGDNRIEKDRDTLEHFLSENAGYKLGIQLVYGGNEEKFSRFQHVYRDADFQNFQLLWHRSPSRPAERVQ
jgi:hypothetical protein